MQHQNKSLSILDEILEDVRKAADRLEEEIGEHAFDDNKSVSLFRNCLSSCKWDNLCFIFSYFSKKQVSERKQKAIVLFLVGM